MAIKDGIRTLLLTQSSITTLCPAQTVRGSSIDCVFVDTIKQGINPPYIKIIMTKHDPRPCLDGTNIAASTGIEIEAVAFTEPSATAIAKAVSDFFKDYSGAAGASDTIDDVWWYDTVDSNTPEQSGEDVYRYSSLLKFTVNHH